MDPKISIITVVYNAKSDLGLTLEALSKLNYDNKELIVIDGGSNDGTVDVIVQFSHYISYWVSEPDSGLYDAMNKGLKVATGEYVWFVNAGDLPYDEDILNRVFLPSENYADIYYGEAMITNSYGVELGLRRKNLPKNLTKNSFSKGMVVCHQAFIVKRSIAPLYNTNLRYVADIEWAIGCIDNAVTIDNSGEIICKFALGGISSAYKKASLIERWGVMKRRYGLFRTALSHIGFIFDVVFRSGFRRVQ